MKVSGLSLPERTRKHLHRRPRPTRRPRADGSDAGRSHGQALIAALLLAAVLAAGTMLAGGALRTRAEAIAHARSLEALAQARNALIGYAISYEERHPGEGYGFLPCPDRGNEGSTPIGACGARDTAAIGRLPWRTLGLPELRDGWGECLWYAVSGSAKHNPKPLAPNWDSRGQFALEDAGGAPLPVAAPDGRAIAVVFAPGRARSGQLRPPARPFRCSGSDAASEDLPHYLDHPFAVGDTGSQRLAQGALRPDDASATNDLLAWVGIDDVFDALRRRHDHAGHIDALIDRAAAALSARLDPANGGETWRTTHGVARGALVIGGLPTAEALGLPAGARPPIDHWRDQMRFAACADGTACIAVSRENGDVTHCHAILAFGGERIRGGAGAQQRLDETQRADPAQYFERHNALHLATGSPAFDGAARFSVADRTQPATADVIRCLP